MLKKLTARRHTVLAAAIWLPTLAACLPDEDCLDTATCPFAAADASPDLASDPRVVDAGRGDVSAEMARPDAELGGSPGDAPTDTLAASRDSGAQSRIDAPSTERETPADGAGLAADGDPVPLEGQRDSGVAVGRPECVSGATRKCRENPEVTALGDCAEGIETCSAGAWSSCSVTAQPKDGCNADDDANCNGAKNEGCACVNGAERPCGINVGACRPGTQICVDAMWSSCNAAPPGKIDCTQSGDKNCNGIEDEREAPCTTCVLGTSIACAAAAQGVCANGTKTCAASADKQRVEWGPCIPHAPASIDGCAPPDDANCDGVVGGGCCATRLCGTTCCAAAPPNTTSGCSASRCTSTCTVPLTCSTSTGLFCGSWNFESNTTEGWSRAAYTPGLDASISDAHAHGSSRYAIAAPFDSTLTNGYYVLLRIRLCGGAAINLQGKSVAAQVYIEAPAQPDDTLGYRAMEVRGLAVDGTGNTAYRVVTHDMYNAWTPVLFTWSPDRPTRTDVVTLELGITLNADVGSMKGVVYFDDIVLDPPL